MARSTPPSEPRDIKTIPSDGYVVFPLSMSRLATGQSPEECYSWLAYFDKKIPIAGCDAVFLYTNGLYQNNDESALDVRKKTIAQMLNHKNHLLNIIVKKRQYMPRAIHFIPWDYAVLDSTEYSVFFDKLRKLYDKDPSFAAHVHQGLAGREATEANILFLIEEIVITHLIRERLVEFPKTLVKNDAFRLIAYPGPCFAADVYQWQKKILPQPDVDNKKNVFRDAQYDFDKHVLYKFADIVLK